jgi:8-hydroxy-5-deazaflavin:NADPH oxidoreductase
MIRYGILGSGAVGQTLAEGFLKHGHEVRIGSRAPGKLAAFSRDTGIEAVTFADAAGWAEALVLSVKGNGAEEALRLAGKERLSGKLVIDTTNPISDEPPQDGVLRYFTGPNESLMERLQAAFPAAHLVKAFNSVGSDRMVNPKYAGGKPTMFFCGNDAGAKAETARVLDLFGWEPADMGSATAARAIEPLAQLWCIPGFLRNQWTHAFKLLQG